MQTYLLLLRGINVGGKHKVVMADLKRDLSQLGFYDLTTYINSGNVIFKSETSLDQVYPKLENYFTHYYKFPIPFILLEKSTYLKQMASLPDDWHQPAFRRDVLFFTPTLHLNDLQDTLQSFSLAPDEKVFVGDIALFWTKANETDYLKTAYHKQLAKSSIYQHVTVRNANTFNKLGQLLESK